MKRKAYTPYRAQRKYTWVYWLLPLMLITCMTFAEESEVIVEPTIDSYTASLVCAAAAIIAEDEQLATWYATNVSDPEGIEYFLNLFTAGLETEGITSEDVADTVEACLKIRASVDAME